jgi:hypothetical protein
MRKTFTQRFSFSEILSILFANPSDSSPLD